ncbi:OLC1v1007277C2 [Oldenlandia corymbosa var. corymbosa]|uniref:Transcription repressor n=1 Tax=Oldenlandia corymbosa var. corymbosa TaxID=529605 RepID=A0AAV1DIX2_OLDCO|nr:OLC1v1007277C2 [Oldenlandia corymbosa var. corymbosa]
MPGGNIGRSLINLCFSKIKSPATISSPGGDHHHHRRPSSTSLFTKNFNSLYDLTFDCTSGGHSRTYTTYSIPSDDNDRLSSSSGSEAELDAAATPDFATVFASQRFFFSSPGRSNSIIDSSSLSLSSLASTSSSSPAPEPNTIIIGGSMAVPTYSPDPYLDFRQSMQEMVEAQDLTDVEANWDYLHELLASYLSLNPKSTHKFIVGAFADLLVSLMTTTTTKSRDEDDELRRKSKLSERRRRLYR